MKPAVLVIFGVLGIVLLYTSTVYVHTNRASGGTDGSTTTETIAAQKRQIERLLENIQALQHAQSISDGEHGEGGPGAASGTSDTAKVPQPRAPQDLWHSAVSRHPSPTVVTGLMKESTHTCYGRTYNPDYWVENTCMYHNMLYDVDKDEFVYVAHSQATAKTVRESGDLVVSTYPQGFSPRVGPVLEEGKLVPVVIAKDDFASKFGDKQIIELSNVHTVYESYNAENFGHFLTDELYPAFSALSSFDLVQPDIQLMRRPTKKKWRYSCDWQVAEWGPGQGKKCDANYKALTPLMSTNSVVKVREYASKLVQEHIPAKDKRKGALLRFRVAVSGFGMLADHCDDPTTHGRRIGSATSFVHHNCNRGRQLQLVNFRKWTMHMLGLDPNARPRKQRVLIWDRAASDYKRNRKVRGLPELKKRIETELQVEVLLYEQWLGKSPEYQIETMASSTVFVTGVGSGSHIGWYLPRGGSMVRVCNVNAEPTHMEWHIFNYMPHFQVEYVEAQKGAFDEEEVMGHVVAGLNRYAVENDLPLVA